MRNVIPIAFLCAFSMNAFSGSPQQLAKNYPYSMEMADCYCFGTGSYISLVQKEGLMEIHKAKVSLFKDIYTTNWECVFSKGCDGVEYTIYPRMGSTFLEGKTTVRKLLLQIDSCPTDGKLVVKFPFSSKKMARQHLLNGKITYNGKAVQCWFQYMY